MMPVRENRDFIPVEGRPLYKTSTPFEENLGYTASVPFVAYPINAVANIDSELIRQVTLSIRDEAKKNRLCGSSFSYYPGYQAPVTFIDNSWRWGNTVQMGSPKQYYDFSEKKDKKDKKDGLAVLIGVILAIAGTCFAAYTQSLLLRYRDRLDEMLDLRCALQYGCIDERINREVVTDFTKLVNLQISIEALKVSKVSGYFIALVSGVISSLLWSVGGAIAAPYVTTVGTVGLVVASLIGAMTLGRHLNDEEQIERHYRVILGISSSFGSSGLADKILLRV